MSPTCHLSTLSIRTRGFVTGVVGLGLLLWGGAAKARYTGKDALALIKLALASCKKPLEAQKQAARAAQDRYPNALVARRCGGKLEISITRLGRRVGAQRWMATWLVDPKRCRAIGVAAKPGDGQLSWPLRFRSDRRRMPSAAERARLLRAAGYVMATRGVTFAAATILATPHRCGELRGQARARGWGLSGPLLRRQPAYPGKPRGSALAAYRRRREVVGVSFVREPERARRYGRYELYVGTLGGRTPDQALAVYDTKRKRHRWVVQTRACTSGRLTWIGQRGGLVVARARPTHPGWRDQRGDSLLLVSLKKAQAYRLLLPRTRTFDVTLTDAGIELKSGGQASSRPAKPSLIPWRAVGRALGMPRLTKVKKVKKAKGGERGKGL